MLINSLIGAQIVGLYVASWETGTFNNADFVFELSDGRYIRIPDFYVSVTTVETCRLDSLHRPAQIVDELRDHYGKYLFGRSIVDILIPRDPDLRTADSAAIKLDSGYYVLQESGAPQGILPGVYLVDAVDLTELQSVFESNEWRAAVAAESRTATEPGGQPDPPKT
jgi:hypothetical protein